MATITAKQVKEAEAEEAEARFAKECEEAEEVGVDKRRRGYRHWFEMATIR